MYVLGILVCMLSMFIIAASGAASGGGGFEQSFSILYDLPTIFSFIVIIASVIIATNSFKTFIKAVNALLSKRYSISAADKEKAVRLFKLLGRSIIYASILFAMMGLLKSLRDLSDINLLGPNIAMTLYSIFQGTFINLILIYPAINILETRYNTEEKTVISEKQVIDKLMELCYKQGITPEEILNANEIHFKELD